MSPATEAADAAEDDTTPLQQLAGQVEGPSQAEEQPLDAEAQISASYPPAAASDPPPAASDPPPATSAKGAAPSEAVPMEVDTAPGGDAPLAAGDEQLPSEEDAKPEAAQRDPADTGQAAVNAPVNASSGPGGVDHASLDAKAETGTSEGGEGNGNATTRVKRRRGVWRHAG